MEDQNEKMLTDKEIDRVEKQLKSVFAGAVTVIVVLLGVMVLSSCSAPAPGSPPETEQQEAFLRACSVATDCPGGMVCSLSDMMPGRCTSACELPQDCYGLLPPESQNDVTCDVEEFLCLPRCSRTVACPDALPACALTVCAESCDGLSEELCWYGQTH